MAPLTRIAPALVPLIGSLPVPKPLAPAVITYLVDEVKRERARRGHEELVFRMAEILRQAGYECARNVFVDLFAASSSSQFLFEMKTNTLTNSVAQVRKAVSQLYEYSYQQDLPSATLVIVLERPLVGRVAWMVNYLVDARGILPVWANSAGGFTGPPASVAVMPWLPA